MKRPKDRFDYDTELGRRLRERRVRAGLTQQELSTAMGRQGKGSHHVAGRPERGEVPNPGVGLIADYLGACRAGFADIHDALGRYTAKSTAVEVQTYGLVLKVRDELPPDVDKAVERYDRRIVKQAELTHEPAERVRRARNFGLSGVWARRVKREVVRVVESRHLKLGTLRTRPEGSMRRSERRCLQRQPGPFSGREDRTTNIPTRSGRDCLSSSSTRRQRASSTRDRRGQGMDIRRVALFAAGILLLSGCATAPQKPSGRPTVVATIGVLADWARQVGGDRVEVRSLLTGNESPHTYEAKPQDAALLSRADILFRVGLGLEDWLDPVVQNAGNQKLVIVDASSGVTDIIQGDEHDRTGNPHIWLDPELAKTGIDNLVRALVRLDPKGESLYRGREAAYFARLDSLSAAISAEFTALSDRRVITYHDAWPYFARRFGLDVIATVEPIPGQEPSAKELARLVDLIRSGHIKVITTEPQLPSALPEMLAKETGVKVLMLNPLLTGPDGTTDYVRGLAASANALAGSLE